MIPLLLLESCLNCQDKYNLFSTFSPPTMRLAWNEEGDTCLPPQMPFQYLQYQNKSMSLSMTIFHCAIFSNIHFLSFPSSLPFFLLSSILFLNNLCGHLVQNSRERLNSVHQNPTVKKDHYHQNNTGDPDYKEWDHAKDCLSLLKHLVFKL